MARNSSGRPQKSAAAGNWMTRPQGALARQLVPLNTEILFLENLEDAQANIDLDGALGREIAKGQRAPTLRIWRSAMKAGIAVSRKDVAAPAGATAMEVLRQEGLDVVVRETGGTAVPQGPGVLHISFLLPRLNANVTTDSYYRLLCWPLLDWLQGLGLQAATGELMGSYCDGTYNVLVNGRKLVGTAQAWRGGLAGVSSRHPGYILAHANLVVEYDLTVATDRINRFYELAGQEYRVLREASTALVKEAPQWFDASAPEEKARQVGKNLASYYSELFHLSSV